METWALYFSKGERKMKEKVVAAMLKLATKTKVNAPVIFAGAAIVGVGITIFETVRATKLAVDDLRQACRDLEIDEDDWKDGMTFQTKARLTWKRFIPVVLSGGLTIGCIFAGQYISIKRTATVAALYAAAEDKLKQYQEAAAETVGEKKANEIRTNMHQKQVNDTWVEDDKDVVITEGGHHLIMDAYSGRYFRGDMEHIRQAEAKFALEMTHSMFQSFEDWCYQVGVPTRKGDSQVGWNLDKPMEITFDATVAGNGEPCIVMDYCAGPYPNFERY